MFGAYLLPINGWESKGILSFCTISVPFTPKLVYFKNIEGFL